MSSLFSAIGWLLMLTLLVLSVFFGFQAVFATGAYSVVYSIVAVLGFTSAWLVAVATDHHAASDFE
jgi:hypothetical protein